MDNPSQNAVAAPAKKKFKMPKWAISLCVLAGIILLIVSSVLIVNTATRNPGVAVFENYLQALRQGNVQRYVRTFEDRNTDDHDRLVNLYTQGNRDAANAANSNPEHFNNTYWLPNYATGSESDQANAIDPNSAIARGISFSTEQIIAQSILTRRIEHEVLISEPNYTRVRFVLTFDENMPNQADNTIPARHWALMDGGNLPDVHIISFHKIGNRWFFGNDFRLYRQGNTQHAIETWYTPVTFDGTSGYKLMHLNPVDLLEDNTFKAISYNNKPVLAIGNRAFMAASDLREVTLNANIRSIGSEAFSGLEHLLRVGFENDTFIEGTTALDVQANRDRDLRRNLTVGHSAFAGTRSLRSFTLSPRANPIIPDSLFFIPSRIPVDPDHPMRTNGITNFNFDGFTENGQFFGFRAVGHYSFFGTDLTNISLFRNQQAAEGAATPNPNTITSIGQSAFENTLLNTISNISIESNDITINNSIPNSVTRIGQNAFRRTRFSHFALPQNFSSIPTGLLDGTTTLTHFYFPSQITQIGAAALRSTAITTVNLPHTLQHIGASAFENASSITRFSTAPLPNTASQYNLRTVGARAFFGANSLQSLTLHSSISSIGDEAFANMQNLRFVDIDFSAGISLGANAFTIRQGTPKFYVNQNLNVSDFVGVPSWDSLPGFRNHLYCRSIVEVFDGFRLAISPADQSVKVIDALGVERVQRTLIQFIDFVEPPAVAAPVDLQNAPITAIGEGAFARALNVNNVFINSNHITSIGPNVFTGADRMSFIRP
ncbi:MAG: leucine-rich repeat domain-containing protein, partial [Firmicutes bacterium]|nr:leucine-rich repeat domain-containing protein [Bacillota bacterium]